jgi:hypothetical protein
LGDGALMAMDGVGFSVFQICLENVGKPIPTFQNPFRKKHPNNPNSNRHYILNGDPWCLNA